MPPGDFPFWFALAVSEWGAAPILFMAFAMHYTQENSRPLKRYEHFILLVPSTIYIANVILLFSHTLNWFNPPLILTGFIRSVGGWTGLISYCATTYYLVIGSLQVRRDIRSRHVIFLTALFLILLGNMIYSLSGAILNIANSLGVSVAVDAGRYLGAFLFAYAILRHRVLDLGFAINRTLVYGAVSVILLAAFGLIEWAVEHFIPIEGREQNALVSAAIAVTVFLTFHRVRDAVEHVVERLFFRRWQRAEAELRRFVREAAFVTQAPALAQAFVRALADYAEGAEAAFYRAEGGGYARAVGEVAGVPARLDPDLPVLVSLRADPKPVELHDDAQGAALIAPMVNRNEVVGIVLLGRKPNGQDYRPDEVELIGWATRQVGLDLHALKVERLEASESDLRRQVSTLEARNQDLQIALGARTPA
jgi:hypothetical protein